MNGNHVDTDSVLFPENEFNAENMNKFHALEEYCGYVSPRSGLGSWDTELTSACGTLLKTKMYHLTGINPKKGETKTKLAIHGMSGMPKKPNKKGEYDAINHIDELRETGSTSYTSRAKPESLKKFALRKLEILGTKGPDSAGSWIQEDRTMKIIEDPNQWVDDTGERRWKVFEHQEWMIKIKSDLIEQDNYYYQGYNPKDRMLQVAMRETKQPLVGVQIDPLGSREDLYAEMVAKWGDRSKELGLDKIGFK